jgi:D-alanine-D-alanine ligase
LKTKLRAAVLMGGQSGEHDVSLVSAKAVLAALDRRKYAPVAVLISRRGGWSARGRAIANPWAFLRRCDLVLPILHGPYGEDGTIQGLLDFMGIPYVGSGVLGSAAGMDKDVMKRLFQQAGLPVGPYVRIDRRDWERAPRAVIARLERALRFPMFVKPANMGSSVGIRKAHGRGELGPALTFACRFDAKLVVEQGFEARELECSVLGNAEPDASVPGEVIAGREFYDYEAKYGDAGSRTVAPAPVNARIRREVRALAVRAFRACECEGLARVDFFLEKAGGKLWVNEVNTMPGFTPISMYPKLWEASGLPFPRLLDRLIALALERHADRERSRRAAIGTSHGSVLK